MQIKQTDTVNISLQFRIIDKSPICYVILYRQIIPLRYKTRVLKILWAIILKYLTFNTYTLVASRKKRALHTCSHQKLRTHCCVQRSPTNRLNRFLQQKVKQWFKTLLSLNSIKEKQEPKKHCENKQDLVASQSIDSPAQVFEPHS